MTFASLGHEVKILRKKRGFSQKELSSGICSQAQISKIEKGDVYPLAPTLYEVANRLGVDINYFFERALMERLDYIEEVYYQIRQAINKYEYGKVKEIIRIEVKSPIYNKHLNFRQFIMWHNGICTYHVDQNVEKSLNLLDQAFNLSHTKKYYSEREIEILNSKGVIFLLTERYLEAIELYQVLLLEHGKLKSEKDPTIAIRLYYNLAKSLNKNKNFDESIKVGEQGIKYCVNKNSMYLLGHLYFQIGFNYFQMELKKESNYYFSKAHTIFDLQNKSDFKEHITKKFLNKIN